MEVYLDNRQDKLEIEENIEELLIKSIDQCLEVEGRHKDYEISVSFVDNDEIRSLNRDYRFVDSETDVLSFPLEDDFGLDSTFLGDIVISLEKAQEQAQDFGHSLEREIVYLTVHSMFHLMGYDHLEDEEREQMRNKEKEVMKNLNIFKRSKGNGI